MGKDGAVTVTVTVQPHLLIQKIRFYYLTVLSSLTDLIQHAKVNGTVSDTRSISAAAARGSVGSSPLFNLCNMLFSRFLLQQQSHVSCAPFYVFLFSSPVFVISQLSREEDRGNGGTELLIHNAAPPLSFPPSLFTVACVLNPPPVVPLSDISIPLSSLSENDSVSQE